MVSLSRKFVLMTGLQSRLQTLRYYFESSWRIDPSLLDFIISGSMCAEDVMKVCLFQPAVEVLPMFAVALGWQCFESIRAFVR